MPSEKVTINTYALDAQETSVKQSSDEGCGAKSGHKGRRYGGKGLVWSLILFIFLVLVVFIILISWSPRWLRKFSKDHDKDCDDKRSERGSKCVDYGKAILWAFVVSIVLVLLFWLLSGVTAGFLRACGKY